MDQDRQNINDKYKIHGHEKCENVDMTSGFRDCWNFPCYKNHTWHYYEIHGQPERSKREDSRECEMRCSELHGNMKRDK